MPDLSSIVGISGLPALIYYGFVVLFAVFFAGFYLKNKLAKFCAENNRELGVKMAELEARMKSIEEETVKIRTYEKDMSNVRDMFTEIKTDMREGFASINSRMDTLFMAKGQ